MLTKQNLNNYTDKYTNIDLWKVLETEHYVFRYSANSFAEKEIQHIAETQESAYQKITNALDLKNLHQKIKYYIYNTEEEKKELMGDDGYAQAIWHDNSVHIVYSENIKPIGEHEDTHLLTLPWGVAIGFFQEGLAEYMSGCKWGRDKQFQKQIPDIKFFFSHDFWVENVEQDIEQYYFVAGLFTKFLIENSGLEKYKRFYSKVSRENSEKENIKIFEHIFGSLDGLLKKFNLCYI